LRARSEIRTQNNPVADYAEWLVSKKLGLELTGFDPPSRTDQS
jgi:hypothetical protein